MQLKGSNLLICRSVHTKYFQEQIRKFTVTMIWLISVLPKQYVPRSPPVKGLPQVDGRLHYSLSKIKDIFYPTLTSLIYLIPGSSPMVGEPSGGGPTANLPIPSSFRSEGPQPVSPDSSIHIECRDPLHLRFRYKMYSSELSPDFLRNRGEFARGKSRPSPVGHIIFIRHDYI